MIYVTNVTPFQKKHKQNSLIETYYLDNRITDKDCGFISAKSFAHDVGLMTESQCHNTCLNRKISINAEGEIKNCPSMQDSYGNIKNTDLIDVVRKPKFRKWWYYRKDDIDVCQDCEFRHICTDCRAFIKDPNNIYSQPAKCGYNPYVALWEGEEGWISVEQWRHENPNWEAHAKENRKNYQIEDSAENLKEELEYFNQL